MGTWRPKWCVFTDVGTSPAHSSPWQTNMQVSDHKPPPAANIRRRKQTCPKQKNKKKNTFLFSDKPLQLFSTAKLMWCPLIQPKKIPPELESTTLLWGFGCEACLRNRFYQEVIENWIELLWAVTEPREKRVQTAAPPLVGLIFFFFFSDSIRSAGCIHMTTPHLHVSTHVCSSCFERGRVAFTWMWCCFSRAWSEPCSIWNSWQTLNGAQAALCGLFFLTSRVPGCVFFFQGKGQWNNCEVNCDWRERKKESEGQRDGGGQLKMVSGERKKGRKKADLFETQVCHFKGRSHSCRSRSPSGQLESDAFRALLSSAWTQRAKTRGDMLWFALSVGNELFLEHDKKLRLWPFETPFSVASSSSSECSPGLWARQSALDADIDSEMNVFQPRIYINCIFNLKKDLAVGGIRSCGFNYCLTTLCSILSVVLVGKHHHPPHTHAGRLI